jgi:hypothetical protein
VWIKVTRQNVLELPLLGSGVQASCNDIEIRWCIEAGAWIFLRGSRALKIKSWDTLLVWHSQHILALDGKSRSAPKPDFKIGPTFGVDLLAMGDALELGDFVSKLLLRDPTANCHLEPTSICNQVKHVVCA